MPSRTIEVWDGDLRAGTAYCDPIDDGMAVEFAYADSYLASPSARPIDPMFPLYSGRSRSIGTPGAFLDATPDSWGRFLIRGKAVADRLGRGLDEIDFLLGASDVTRQGSLRFSLGDGFLAAGADVPMMVDLPQLRRLASDAASDHQALVALLAGGAESSGGAVPKAAVRGEDGALWIAKFYDGDTGLWEKVVVELAVSLGIKVPETRLMILENGSVLLSKRFDREAGRRIPYLSAATLTGMRSRERGDYLYILGAINDFGSAPRKDGENLWRRMVFFVAVNNTDDHLRNHGFLWDGSGWRLSPMFDVVPADKISRSTSINGETARPAMLDALLTSAADFGVDRDTAIKIVRETWTATSDWAMVARRLGASQRSIDAMVPTFDGLRGEAEATRTNRGRYTTLARGINPLVRPMWSIARDSNESPNAPIALTRD